MNCGYTRFIFFKYSFTITFYICSMFRLVFNYTLFEIPCELYRYMKLVFPDFFDTTHHVDILNLFCSLTKSKICLKKLDEN